LNHTSATGYERREIAVWAKEKEVHFPIKVKEGRVRWSHLYLYAVAERRCARDTCKPVWKLIIGDVAICCIGWMNASKTK
jgi:hypothetical protein